MSQTANQLYDYHVWANQRLLRHLKELPCEIYTKEVQSVFPSISQVIAHLYVVDNIWLGAMSGDIFEKLMALAERLSKEAKEKTLEEMETMFHQLSERYKAFLHGKSDLDQPMVISHPRLGQLKTSISQIVQHVVNHGTYHRGNITAMLRQLGSKGVSTDFIFYLYEQER